MWYNAANITTVIEAVYKAGLKYTKDTPDHALMVELWGVFCENFEDIWPCYNGTALYMHQCKLCLVIIGSGSSLQFIRHQAISWTNAEIADSSTAVYDAYN